MKVQMHSVHFDADKKLVDFMQKKVNKLETFYDRITGGEVIMKLDNNESGDNKIVEVKIFMPGTTLFVKEQAKTFELAANMAVENLSRQIKKFKEKQLAA